MKQTSSAWGMLMHAYKSVFRAAWLKGMASAVVLTAGLSAQTAQTAEDHSFHGFMTYITEGWSLPSGEGSSKVTALDTEQMAALIKALAPQESTSQLENAGGEFNASSVQSSLQSGGIFTYSGTAVSGSEGTEAVHGINLAGKTNIDSDGTLQSSVTGKLSIGKDGDLALSIKRGSYSAGDSNKKYVGGGAFGAIAMSAAEPAGRMDLTVSNSSLSVADSFYVDDAVIGGFVLNKSGDATASNNTLTYTSSNVTQADKNSYKSNQAAIPNVMMAGGYARVYDGNATVTGNTMQVTGSAKSKTDLSAKTYFGGGYAVNYGSGDNTGTSLLASQNKASFTNITFSEKITSSENSRQGEAGSGRANTDAINFFGGLAKTQYNGIEAITSVKAKDNELTFTNAEITADTSRAQVNGKVQTGIQIIGGRANSASSAQATVSSSGNKVTLNSTGDASTSVIFYGPDFIAGGYASQGNKAQSGATVTAINNTVSIEGNVTISGGSIYGGRAENAGGNTDPAKGLVTKAIDNKVIIDGTARLTNTSVYAAAIRGNVSSEGAKDQNQDLVFHEGNTAILGKDAQFIASGDQAEIAGDILDIKGTVWATDDEGSEIIFGGIRNEEQNDVLSYHNGTGSVTGTLYNQGKVSVYVEVDMNKATLYSLANGANITVNGSNAFRTDVLPLDPGHATLKISEQQVQDYLTSEGTSVALPDNTKGTAKTAAGSISVTSGGAIDFGKSVTLSNFSFKNAAATSTSDEPETEPEPEVVQKAAGNGLSDLAGFIVVDRAPAAEPLSADSDAKTGSYFKAETMTLEHALGDNKAQEKQGEEGEGEEALDASQIHLVADTLKLGSAALSSAESAKIQFADARVSKNIDFSALNDGETNTGYLLTSHVIGSAYHATADSQGQNPYFTAQAGSINGDVTITAAESAAGQTLQGQLTIQNGNWTAQDAITVASGGTLLVGGPLAEDSTYKDADGQRAAVTADATLQAAGGLVLDVSKAGTATVSVSGNTAGFYNAEEAAQTAGDDRLVSLDLGAGGLTLKGDADKAIQGKASLTVSNGGVVKLKASDVNTILEQNGTVDADSKASAGAFFTAQTGGVFLVSGAMQADFAAFSSGENATNGFNLQAAAEGTAAGALVADSLTVSNAGAEGLTTAQDEGFYSFKSVNFGGIVAADDLRISDLQVTNGSSKPEGTGSYASHVTIGSGEIYVARSLASDNHTLILGTTGEDASQADLILSSKLKGDAGTINVAELKAVNGSIRVENGQWTGAATTISLASGGTSLTVGGNFDVDDKGNEFAAGLSAAGISMAESSLLKVAANGKAEFAAADFSKLKEATFAKSGTEDTDSGVQVYGSLTINGDASATITEGGQSKTDPRYGVKFGQAGSISIQKNGQLTFGSLATTGAIIAEGKYDSADAVKEGIDDDFRAIANQGGTLRLSLSKASSFSAEAIKQLKTSLFTSGSLQNGVLTDGGILSIGQAGFDGIKVHELSGDGLSGYYATWDELSSFSDIYGEDVSNEQLMQTNVQAISAGDHIQGHWGSLSTDSTSSSSSVTISGTTSLHYAAGNNGFFVSDKDHKVAANVTVQAQNTLSLVNGGKAGTITLQGTEAEGEQNVTALEVRGEGLTTLAGIKGNGKENNTQVILAADTAVTGEIKDLETVRAEGAAVTATKVDVGALTAWKGASVKVADKLSAEEVSVVGAALETKDLQLAGSDSSLDLLHGGSLTVSGTLKADNSSLLQVGYDLTAEELATLSEQGIAEASGTGYLEAGVLDLNGATLFVDPAYGEKTSIAAAGKFASPDSKYSYDNDKGTLSGSVLIGKNAAVGIGATVAETAAAIARYQSAGSLSADSYGSVLYLNGQIKVSAGSEIALNAAEEAVSEDAVRQSLVYSTGAQSSQHADLGLGKHTAVLMSAKAFEDADGKKTGTAMYFDKSGAVVNGLGGDIVLTGAFDVSDKLMIFDDQDNNGVDVQGSVKVLTQNGFLYAVLSGQDQGRDVQLNVDKDKAYQVMNEASRPVVETLIAYGSRQTQAAASGTAEGKAAAEASAAGSSSFLNAVITTSHGAPAESAARMAVYGGAVDAVLAAAATSSDAIASRMGMGNQNSVLTYADNGAGAGIWLAPVYRHQESDGFGAQGVNYGADLDLYGLALGADYTFAQNFRAGAMFNVGSGDADGQGAGSAVSNDFDYWGIAVYGGFSYENFSVTADLGYTAVDNDLDAGSGMEGFGKLTASTDTEAWTMGLTAQYRLSTEYVDITPHIGARFTRIDMDNYSVGSDAGKVAGFSADSMSVFSIPVGVSLSYELSTASGWKVMPALDFTVTANTGDDEFDGDVAWTGTNLTTATSTEVLDSVTYGVNMGLSAEYSNFSLGLGVNYTGSDNTDAWGVQANARFTF